MAGSFRDPGLHRCSSIGVSHGHYTYGLRGARTTRCCVSHVVVGASGHAARRPAGGVGRPLGAGRRPVSEPGGGRCGLGKAAAKGAYVGGVVPVMWAGRPGAAGGRRDCRTVITQLSFASCPTHGPARAGVTWLGRVDRHGRDHLGVGRGPCERRNRPWRSLPAGPRVRPGRWQVFGLSGPDRQIHLLSVASQAGGPVLDDGVRSRLPLRGSPGFPPGSLLPLRRRDGGEPVAEPTLRQSAPSACATACRVRRLAERDPRGRSALGVTYCDDAIDQWGARVGPRPARRSGTSL